MDEGKTEGKVPPWVYESESDRLKREHQAKTAASMAKFVRSGWKRALTNTGK